MTKHDMRYITRIPKNVRRGYVLCHNHIQHTVDTPIGVNGFRAWFNRAQPPDDFVECPCGWSGLPHYAHERHVKATGGKCEPIGRAFTFANLF